MDSPRKSCIVKIHAAYYDPGVGSRSIAMYPHEVKPVMAHKNATLRDCEGEHITILDRAVCVASFKRGQDTVPERAERFDHLEFDILVRIDARHVKLRGFVFADLRIDRGRVRPGVSPSVLQIVPAERGVAGQ